MAKNKLTPEQDLITREFYTVVASDDSLLPDNPATVRQLRAILLQLLDYEVWGKAFVKRGTVKSRKMGEIPQVQDEWGPDTERTIRELGLEEFYNLTDTDNSGSGESPSGSTLGNLLRKKV